MQTDRLTKSLLLVRSTGKKRADLHDKSSAFSAGLSPGMTGKSETRRFRMANGNRRINTYSFPVPKDLELPADMFAWKQASQRKSHNGERYVMTPVTDRYRTYHAYNRQSAEEEHKTFCLNWRNKQKGVETEFSLMTTGFNPSQRFYDRLAYEESYTRKLARHLGIPQKEKCNSNFKLKVLRVLAKKGKWVFLGYCHREGMSKEYRESLWAKITK